jgi:serine protease Do
MRVLAASGWLVALASITAGAVEADTAPAPRAPLSAQEISAFEKSLQELYRRVAPATVNLFAEPKHEHKGSGVVIDAAGHVLTHAHHGLSPGAVVSAVFADGKRAGGKILGVHEPVDLSLVQLDGPGPWPTAPLGDAAGLKAGDPCVMLGYPKLHHVEGLPPLFRVGRFAGAWGHYLFTSCNINGGDSGGPLFGFDGALLGNTNLFPTEGHGTGHTSVEYFRQSQPRLLAGHHGRRDAARPVTPQGHGDQLAGAFEGATGLEPLVGRVNRTVLTVLDGDRPVALGVVVDADGWAVSKASELPVGRVNCQLADGRKVEATVAGRDGDSDLALLKLPTTELPVAAWADQTPEPGRLLVAIGPADRPLALGIVGSTVRRVPGVSGVLAFDVAAGSPNGPGVFVSSIHRSRPRTAAALKQGDSITRVGETPTPDLDAFTRAVAQSLRGPAGRPGERVRLTIVRDSREQVVAVPVEAPYIRPWSARHDGFAAAFVYDAVVLPAECGGPLIGLDGKVAGVVAARIGPETRTSPTPSDSRTYAIPAAEVRRVVAELRRAEGGKR